MRDIIIGRLFIILDFSQVRVSIRQEFDRIQAFLTWQIFHMDIFSHVNYPHNFLWKICSHFFYWHMVGFLILLYWHMWVFSHVLLIQEFFAVLLLTQQYSHTSFIDTWDILTRFYWPMGIFSHVFWHMGIFTRVFDMGFSHIGVITMQAFSHIRLVIIWLSLVIITRSTYSSNAIWPSCGISHLPHKNFFTCELSSRELFSYSIYCHVEFSWIHVIFTW